MMMMCLRLYVVPLNQVVQNETRTQGVLASSLGEVRKRGARRPVQRVSMGRFAQGEAHVEEGVWQVSYKGQGTPDWWQALRCFVGLHVGLRWKTTEGWVEVPRYRVSCLRCDK